MPTIRLFGFPCVQTASLLRRASLRRKPSFPEQSSPVELSTVTRQPEDSYHHTTYDRHSQTTRTLRGYEPRYALYSALHCGDRGTATSVPPGTLQRGTSTVAAGFVDHHSPRNQRFERSLTCVFFHVSIIFCTPLLQQILLIKKSIYGCSH